MLEDIKTNGIKIYDFPECDPEESDEFKRQDAELKVRRVQLCDEELMIENYNSREIILIALLELSSLIV